MTTLDHAEVGSIERELYIDASPEIVFDVVSKPEHVARWWPDTASYDVRSGATGEVTFGDPSEGGKSVTLTVVDVEPPRTFSFRWTHAADEPAQVGNSLLVTFELVPTGAGTTLKFIETGFREMGWDAATTEATVKDHVNGWDTFLPRIAPYVASLASRS